MTPAAVIAELTASGLRGRGGAGFPTGMKWAAAAAAKGDRKYIVCNADEGEPGTFKDRIILGKHADMVFEGMTVAAYVVGSREGIVYLRYEYSHLRPHLEFGADRKAPGQPAGRWHPRPSRLRFRHPHPHGRRRLCLRRGNRADRIAGRTPRRAAQPAALSGRTRLQRLPDRGEQRRDAGVGLLHPRSRRQVVRQHGHRPLQGLQTVQCLRRLLASRASTSCPGASPSTSCWTPWAARAPRRCRSAATPGSSCRPASSTARSPMRISASAARSSSTARTATCCDIAENYLEFFIEESCGQCTPCREGNVKLLEGVRLLQQRQVLQPLSERPGQPERDHPADVEVRPRPGKPERGGRAQRRTSRKRSWLARSWVN